MSESWGYSEWKVLHNFGKELYHSHIFGLKMTIEFFIQQNSYFKFKIFGFPISKSLNPKSVVLKEFILIMLLPLPGIEG